MVLFDLLSLSLGAGIFGSPRDVRRATPVDVNCKSIDWVLNCLPLSTERPLWENHYSKNLLLN